MRGPNNLWVRRTHTHPRPYSYCKKGTGLSRLSDLNEDWLSITISYLAGGRPCSRRRSTSKRLGQGSTTQLVGPVPYGGATKSSSTFLLSGSTASYRVTLRKNSYDHENARYNPWRFN